MADDRGQSPRAKFLQLARDRFKQAQDAEKLQRARELDDLRFYAGDQWPDEIKNSRKGQDATASPSGGAGLPPVPARPCMTINNTREPVRQVLNQERAADMSIEIVAADDFGDLNKTPDDTEIKLREGLTRRIQRESKAADARTWAFMRAVVAGRGFYGVMTRYAKGKTFDKEIYIHRYYNQACVVIDPAHEQPDGSDAEWGFVGTDITWDAYKAQYKKRNGKDNTVCSWSDDDWRGLGDEAQDWFKDDGKTKICRVVDYWFTVWESRELVRFSTADKTQERSEWADDLDGEKASPELVSELAGWVEMERRTVTHQSIKWAKIDGCDDDVLEETDWEGPDMPIVKVMGEELQPYDKERRAEGMIRPMREPGQGFNYMVSRWVEVIGLSPLVPYMVEEGTIEGYEDWWQAANTRTLPYLPFKSTNLTDLPANIPTVPPARNPPIEAIAASVQLFKTSLQSTSGIEAAALGQADSSVRSNKQARLLVEQSRQGSSHFLDNLQRSIRYEAQVVNNLLYPIYGRKGRIARILNAEGEAERVLLHQPMVMDGDRPVPADGNPNAKMHTLTKDAQFNVAIKIAKDTGTRREQETEIISALLQAQPELITWFGDLFFKNQDGPGHQEMAERAKVMLDPKIQQMLAAKAQGSDVSPEVQAQLAGAQQQIEQLTAQLQEASKPGAVAQVKGQADLAKAQLDTASREKIAAAQLAQKSEESAADNETKLAIAELNALAKQMADTLALFAAERARVGVQGHEVGMTAMTQQATADEAERARQAQSAESEAGRLSAAEQAEAARQHEAEMARQAAQGNGGGA